MLEIVQHEEQPPLPNAGGKQVAGRQSAGLVDTEGPRDGWQNECRVSESRQIDERHTIRKLRPADEGGLLSQAGLTDPTGPVSVTRRAAPSNRSSSASS